MCRGGDEEEGDERYGVPQVEPPPGQPLFRGEDRARAYCRHILYTPRFAACFGHLSRWVEISNGTVCGVG
jgi:hypothetical protein